MLWLSFREVSNVVLFCQKAITRKELSTMLGGKFLFSASKCAEFVELVFEVMAGTLERGEKIKISGFGNFVLKEKAARRGRNPQTGEKMEIAARRVVTFKPSLLLRKAMNRKTTWQRKTLSARLCKGQFSNPTIHPDENSGWYRFANAASCSFQRTCVCIFGIIYLQRILKILDRIQGKPCILIPVPLWKPSLPPPLKTKGDA